MELSAPTVTEALADEFRRAVNALPPAHRIEPQENELVESPDVKYVRLQDWAFTQGFALVKESSRAERWVLQCIHYKKETKDWRKHPKKVRNEPGQPVKLWVGHLLEVDCQHVLMF